MMPQENCLWFQGAGREGDCVQLLLTSVCECLGQLGRHWLTLAHLLDTSMTSTLGCLDRENNQVSKSSKLEASSLLIQCMLGSEEAIAAFLIVAVRALVFATPVFKRLL